MMGVVIVLGPCRGLKMFRLEEPLGRTAWKNLPHPTSILVHGLNQRRGAPARSPCMVPVRQQDDIRLDYRKRWGCWAPILYQSSQSIDSGHFSQPSVLVVRSGSGSPGSEDMALFEGRFQRGGGSIASTFFFFSEREVFQSP